MGYDVTASVVVGVRTTMGKLYTTFVTSGCRHNPRPSLKFCPECGEKNGIPTHDPIPGFNPYSETYKGLDVLRTDSSESDSIVVGLVVSECGSGDNRSDSGPKAIGQKTLSTIIDQVKTVISGDVISEKGDFGIWLCVYESF